MSQVNGEWISRDEIRAPMPAYGDDGEVGDGLVVLTSDNDAFQVWADWLEQSGEKRPA